MREGDQMSIASVLGNLLAVEKQRTKQVREWCDLFADAQKNRPDDVLLEELLCRLDAILEDG